MDLQALMGQFLSEDGIQGLSQTTGASKKEVKNVISAALPTLLNGANEQAQNKETAAGFAGALNQHAAAGTGNLHTFFKDVDLDDGAKIVGHLLGAKKTEETQNVSKKTGVSTKKTGAILAAAAPLLMSLLGQQAKDDDEAQAGNAAGLLSGLLGKTDMTSLMMSLLGDQKDDDEEKEEKKDGGFDLGNVAGILTNLFK